MKRIMVTGDILRAGMGANHLWGEYVPCGWDNRGPRGSRDSHLDSVF